MADGAPSISPEMGLAPQDLGISNGSHPSESREQDIPKNGVERYLATLQKKQPGDDERINKWIELRMTLYHRLGKMRDSDQFAYQTGDKPLEEMLTAEEIPIFREGEEARIRESYEVQRAILPRVVANLQEMLTNDRFVLHHLPTDIKFHILSPEISAKIIEAFKRKLAGDLSRVLAFDPLSPEGAFTQKDAEFALALVNRFIGKKNESLYAAGIPLIAERIVKERRQDPTWTHKEEAMVTQFGTALVKEAQVLARAIGGRNLGQFESTGKIGLELWARRVDPQFYQECQEASYGIHRFPDMAEVKDTSSPVQQIIDFH